MLIDSHQHFWTYRETEYRWIGKGSPLQRDWLPADLRPLLAKVGLEGSIAAQARPTIEESHWLLHLPDHYPLVKAVVCCSDLRSENCGTQLAELSKQP